MDKDSKTPVRKEQKKAEVMAVEAEWTFGPPTASWRELWRLILDEVLVEKGAEHQPVSDGRRVPN
jgi:hypothetical protein